jgi:hypothetical protein
VQRWEYLEARWDGRNLTWVDDEPIAPAEQRKVSRRQWMTALGDDGWELVNADGVRFYFKRPKE